MHPDDAQFLHAFESCTLPFAEWRHRAHLRVAYLYLRELPYDRALEKIRRNIQRYNAATNTPEELERGYHETMTQAWMRLVAFALDEQGPAASSNEFLDREEQLLNRKALLFFYSRPQIVSWRAKAEFVEPDLTPFPYKVGGTSSASPTLHSPMRKDGDSRSSSLQTS